VGCTVSRDVHCNVCYVSLSPLKDVCLVFMVRVCVLQYVAVCCSVCVAVLQNIVPRVMLQIVEVFVLCV